MRTREHDALVLDLDGTLLDEGGGIDPENLAALRAAGEQGVRVMIATGRSSLSAHPILEALALETPAIVFNGAALYDSRTKRMLEERVLSNRTLSRALAYGRAHDLLTVVMCAQRKLSMRPRTDEEAAALALMTALEYVEPEDLAAAEFAIRVTFFSDRHRTSAELAREVEERIDLPVYLTDFPLSVLPTHRTSALSVVDVHPPCRGKAEALRVLEERYAIDPRRVVAVGDATNDIPMFEAAGLAVAMAGAMEEARLAADRVIGSHDTTAIALLVEELFLARRRERA